jgi:hypothetical protein
VPLNNQLARQKSWDWRGVVLSGLPAEFFLRNRRLVPPIVNGRPSQFYEHPEKIDTISTQIRLRHMLQRPQVSLKDGDLHSFAKLMRRLGETFAVRDVMVPLSRIEYVPPGDEDAAKRIVAEKRYSVIPVSDDGENFDSVFCTEHPVNGSRTITTIQSTSVSDHIPDSTPLAEAFFLFENREWYLTLRGNRVSGLVTYWAFNSREFRVQLYAGLSRVEELSRDVLAKDGSGVSNEKGLSLTPQVLEEVRKRFESARREMGGHRFVDELQFHQVNDALRKHSPWRDFLRQRLGRILSNGEYERLYNFTRLRDAVMHGRVLFPAYRDFKKFIGMIDNIGEFIDHLDAYEASLAIGLDPTG